MFYRPGPGGCYVCCVVVEGFGEQNKGVSEVSEVSSVRSVGSVEMP